MHTRAYFARDRPTFSARPGEFPLFRIMAFPAGHFCIERGRKGRSKTAKKPHRKGLPAKSAVGEASSSSAEPHILRLRVEDVVVSISAETANAAAEAISRKDRRGDEGKEEAAMKKPDSSSSLSVSSLAEAAAAEEEIGGRGDGRRGSEGVPSLTAHPLKGG